MIMYLQIHASLEKIRKLADESSASKKPEEQWSNGPITMIVGKKHALKKYDQFALNTSYI